MMPYNQVAQMAIIGHRPTELIKMHNETPHRLQPQTDLYYIETVMPLWALFLNDNSLEVKK